MGEFLFAKHSAAKGFQWERESTTRRNPARHTPLKGKKKEGVLHRHGLFASTDATVAVCGSNVQINRYGAFGFFVGAGIVVATLLVNRGAGGQCNCECRRYVIGVLSLLYSHSTIPSTVLS